MSSPAPLGRKASVSISEETPRTESVSKIAPAGNKIAPKDAEKQLMASIPEKEAAIVAGWKVKQVTRPPPHPQHAPARFHGADDSEGQGICRWTALQQHDAHRSVHSSHCLSLFFVSLRS
jgi:hypothetical protein